MPATLRHSCTHCRISDGRSYNSSQGDDVQRSLHELEASVRNINPLVASSNTWKSNPLLDGKGKRSNTRRHTASERGLSSQDRAATSDKVKWMRSMMHAPAVKTPNRASLDTKRTAHSVASAEVDSSSDSDGAAVKPSTPKTVSPSSSSRWQRVRQAAQTLAVMQKMAPARTGILVNVSAAKGDDDEDAIYTRVLQEEQTAHPNAANSKPAHGTLVDVAALDSELQSEASDLGTPDNRSDADSDSS